MDPFKAYNKEKAELGEKMSSVKPGKIVMVKFFQATNCVISQRIFCVIVKAVPVDISKNLCDGILKRVFSKQICFSYRIESYDCEESCFRIYFRFICWDKEGQKERYRKFRNMPQEKIEENVSAHSRKTLDNFVGEFFKRLKRKNFTVEINGETAEVFEA